MSLSTITRTTVRRGPAPTLTLAAALAAGAAITG